MKSISELLRLHAQRVVHHARAVVVASLVVTGIVGAGVSRLHVDLDPEQQLPATHHYIAVDREIRKQFGGRNFTALALIPKNGTIWQREVLEVVHAITLELLNARGVIRPNVISLSSPYVRIPKDQDGVLGVDYLMKEVPPDDAGIAAVRALYHREPLFKGTVVSDDERAALILADFYDGTSVSEIAALMRALVMKYRTPALDFAVTGQPIYDNEQAIWMQDQASFFGGTVAAILLVLGLAFGHVQGVVLPAATALLSTTIALGVMGFAGIPLNAWTASVPLIVMTVSAGHSAQMLKRYYEEFQRSGDRATAVIDSTERIGEVMLAAGLTAGGGFAALALLGVPSLAHFGLGVACGIFAAVALEMTFMLALRVLWRSGGHGSGEGPLGRWLGVAVRPLIGAVAGRPLVTVAVYVAIALAAATAYPRLTTEVTRRTYWSERTEAGRDLRTFEQHFPSTTTLTILLSGEPGIIKTPEALQLMSGLQQTMAEEPGVGRTSSLADIIRRTYEVFAPEDAARGLKLEPDLVSQLFFLAESPAFERYVDRAYSRSVVYGFLNRDDTALTRHLITRLEQYLSANPSEHLRVTLAGGVAPTMLAVNEHTVNAKLANIAVVFGVIFVIASILLRTPLGGFYVTAPLAMALIVNLGLFAWLGIAFDLGGASIAAIGVSIGADYAIYFLYRLREEYRRTAAIDEAFRATMETTGRAVLFVALAISAGFAVYMASDFYTFYILGFFVPLTMMVSSITALTLLPALVLLMRPRFIFGSAPPPGVPEPTPAASRRVIVGPPF